ncbi:MULTISPECIES: cupin domain-containing protein [unclassified Pseudonocardia]|uniref:cupin domain-containing protein n=1 Tax=unclassified Pseudonocardia TaxID=2619320 RepID=UPI00095E9B83|nr:MULTISPECIES: cupin domain-containing protein [unclassified Pseudonocardia]MBN9099331.1 cupin domain-containing protein [Pseudonocardia sp.]OJY53117.1 MAG: hypothetical protein BGP03_01855 [Pseudonocardia sp. 73-21]
MTLQTRNLDSPDEKREFDHGAMHVLALDGTTFVRGVLEPGWRWSIDVQPLVGTDSCQVAHASYIISGRFGVRLDDGTETEAGPGDALAVSPGHDAWVVGDQPCTIIDFAPAPAGDATRIARCPCGVQFRIDGTTDTDGAQLEHLIAAVQQHAAGSHGHDVDRDHILDELTTG